MESPGGLVVENLTPVRQREGFEELTGLLNGTAVGVGVIHEGLLSPKSSEAFADIVRRSLPLAAPGLARTLALEPAGPQRWAVLWERFGVATASQWVAQHGHLSLDDSLSTVIAVCRALKVVHEAGLTHGDLSADWVLVAPHGSGLEVKLAGLGLGQLRDVARGRTATVRDDLAGVGALLHHLVSGVPFAGKPLLPPNALHLSNLLNRCVSIDVSSRFRSVDELLEALVDANRTRVSPGKVTGERPVVQLRTLGPWELVRLLGEGAMGQVFLARHTLLGRQAAIKVLRPEQYQRDDLLQRFFQEARSVNQINHEHIVEISDFGQELGPDGKPNAVYFVMELLQGETLGQRLASGPLSLDRAIHIVKQLASALAAAHRLGVVHRDVKPDNVFLISRHGDPDYVKVLDFGVAKLTQLPQDAPSVSTMDGAIIGTPTSMSPEQASGQSVDQRADVYAVGVMLYLLVSGRLPFDADNFGKLIAMLLTQPAPPLPAVSAGGEAVPPKLAQLIMRCLAKRPEDRPQSMDTLVAELHTSLARRTQVTDTAMPTVVTPPKRPLWPFVAVGVMLVGGVAAFLALRPQMTRDPQLPPDAGSTVAMVVPPPVVELPDAAAPTPTLDAGEAPLDAGPHAGALDASVPLAPRLVRRPVELDPVLWEKAFQAKKGKVQLCVNQNADAIAGAHQLETQVKVDKKGRATLVSLKGFQAEGKLTICLSKAIADVDLPPLLHERAFRYLIKIQ